MIDEAELKRTHAWCRELIRNGNANIQCNPSYEAIPKPKEEYMSVKIGDVWYKATEIHYLVNRMGSSILLNQVTRSDRIIITILHDMGLIPEPLKTERR